jgi:hypothetical protein
MMKGTQPMMAQQLPQPYRVVLPCWRRQKGIELQL